MEVKYSESTDFVFQEAVEFLKNKKPLTKEQYEAIKDSARARAFTVTGYTNIEVLQQFIDELTNTLEQGQTKEYFRDRMNVFLEEHGYKGMNRNRSDTIFQTNMQTAYNVGHYESMNEPMVKKLRPYWQYVTAGDGKVRESHALMEGKVYHADDPIWDIWYPPNGFGCRCSVVTLSKRQMEQRELKLEQEIPYTVNPKTGEISSALPDKGFSYNPAAKEWNPDLSKAAPLLQAVYQERLQNEIQADLSVKTIGGIL